MFLFLHWFTFGSLTFSHDLSTYMSLFIVLIRQSAGLINVNICALSSSWKILLKCFIKSKILLTVTHTIFCVLLRKRKTARDIKLWKQMWILESLGIGLLHLFFPCALSFCTFSFMEIQPIIYPPHLYIFPYSNLFLYADYCKSKFCIIILILHCVMIFSFCVDTFIKCFIFYTQHYHCTLCVKQILDVLKD